MNKKPKLDEIIAGIKRGGFRITASRRRIIEILCQSDVPLAAAELLEHLREGRAKVNKTTVYRELEFLHGQKVIRQIDLLEGKKRYEVVHADSHHHHAVCTHCQSIQCIEMGHDLAHVEKRLREQHGFRVSSHSLEFFGLCAKCARE